MLSFKEQQEAWAKEAESLFKAGQRRNYACGCCGLTNGKGMVYVSSNQACHAGLSVGKGSEADYAHTYIMYTYECRDKPENVMEDEMAIAFLDYLIHNSVYSPAFVQEQDAAEVWKTGVLSTHTDKVSANLMVAAHIAARRLTEYRHIVRSWYELVKRGVEGDLAFLIAHKVQISWVNGPAGNFKGRIVEHSIDGHTSVSVNSLSSAAVYKIVVDKEMAGARKETYKEFQNYRGINDSWCKAGFNLNYPDLRQMCAEVHVDAKLQSGINPFPPVKEDQGSYAVNNLFDALAESAIEYYEGLKQCEC